MKSLLAKWSTFPIIKPPIKVAPFVASEYTTEKINRVNPKFCVNSIYGCE